MHELSIALSLVDVAADALRARGPLRVVAVHLRLGPLSGVVKEALLFSFDAAIAGTALEGAYLRIEDVPAIAWCDRCAAAQALTDVARRRCPACDAVTPRLLQGAEMELTGLEVVEL